MGARHEPHQRGGRTQSQRPELSCSNLVSSTVPNCSDLSNSILVKPQGAKQCRQQLSAHPPPAHPIPRTASSPATSGSRSASRYWPRATSCTTSPASLTPSANFPVSLSSSRTPAATSSIPTP